MGKVKVIVPCLVSGYLRRGYYEMTLTEDEFAKFSASDDDDKREWICEEGEFEVTDSVPTDIDMQLDEIKTKSI